MIVLGILIITLISIYLINKGKIVNCASEGEQVSGVYTDEFPQMCCEGLIEWNSGFDTRISIGEKCYETGMVAGNPVGTCINCGNGICEEIENVCNCPEDCGAENSDYKSVNEFCSIQGEYWNNLCEEDLMVQELSELCGLCN